MFDDDHELPEDLGALGYQLMAQASDLEQTYPSQVNARTQVFVGQHSGARRPTSLTQLAVALSIGSVIAVVLVAVFGSVFVAWDILTPRRQRNWVVQARPAQDVSKPSAVPTQRDTAEFVAVADASAKEASGDRFSVRELVASADMLEEQTEADAELSDAQKIELLEKALDRYRSVIIYLQDEIQTRDEERAAQAQQLQNLEQRLRLLEALPAEAESTR
ncbi:MAG TPA: hypothetical protein DCY79_05650 [Planctomycetaceae bacterium]|nr:hypothetical protein [Blastopirellula sp.]HAY79275.1 hypothetical protein [Planctomycetaceae bacterium]|tara:strand:- start:78 stop:734 length:657 start_codon:yes stop_codon:yes gene_type:complete